MGIFWSGARAGGNNVFTRGGSLPLCLLEKGDKIANLVDFSLMEKRAERPLLSRAKHSSIEKYLGVFVLAFPRLKATATSWSEEVFDDRPSHTSNRPSSPG